MTFILNEDNALKNILSGITVSDERNPARKVGVWFGQPDVEIQNQSYPYITIDLIDVREATERAHRNHITLPYVPEGYPVPTDGKGYVVDYPIPYDLMYQVTTYARQPRHDRQIIHEIMLNRLGGRMHSLAIPEDGTERSMFLLGSRKRDSTENGRRLFSNAYTVQVFSELFPTQVMELSKVLTVSNTFSQISS